MEESERSLLLGRLSRLERELVAVRRELHEKSTVTFPEGIFQALCVQVGGERYAVPSAQVKQIIRYARTTRVPHAPRAVQGVLNLRGEVVVVLDTCERLGLGRAAIDAKTPVVIVAVHHWLVGLIVDRVLEVVTIDGSTLSQPSGAIAASVNVAAVGSVAGELVQLFDLEQLLSPSELERMEGAIDHVTVEVDA
jgi:purine-binding chemotaxis protein CheW